jgi:uncharacterized protein YecE (DUF72 family)
MIKIGTSGFSFDDWKGTVYPEKIKKQDMLSFYVQEFGFNTLEVNFTYYMLPSEKTISGMEKKTSGDFEFIIKAYKGMTHDPFDSRLAKKPDEKEVEENFKKFVYGISPLVEAGKLGAVLMQFPIFFKPLEQSREYLLKSKELLKNIPMVVEFRNNGWDDQQVYEFLRENSIGFCAVDEPQLSGLMPFAEEVTSDIGYVRFHGRNKHWFNAPAADRYNYLYKETELEDFIRPIKNMEKKAQKEFVFFNNCHSGSAVRNALMLKKMLLNDSE